MMGGADDRGRGAELGARAVGESGRLGRSDLTGKGLWSLSLREGAMSLPQPPTDECTSSFPEEIITPNYYY